ncbi:MAG: site-specific DNA-methyltransferase [Thermaceae bacterium]|nr:site-specific DNA-methyltransferase [Thermaceae bacterium]
MKRSAWDVYQEVLAKARELGLPGEEAEQARALLSLPQEAFTTLAKELRLKPKYLRHDLLPVAFLPQPLKEALRLGLPLRHAHRLHRLLKRGEIRLEELEGRPPEALRGLPYEEVELDPMSPVWIYPKDPRPEALSPAVARALVVLYTRPGELVVDPLAGYGTVVEAALSLGRRAWGGDIRPMGPRVEQADIKDLSRRFREEAALLFLHPPTFRSWLREEGYRESPEERYGAYVEYLQGLLEYALPALQQGGRLILAAQPRHSLSSTSQAAGRDFFLAPFERALAEVDPALKPIHHHQAVSREGRGSWHLFVAEFHGKREKAK